MTVTTMERIYIKELCGVRKKKKNYQNNHRSLSSMYLKSIKYRLPHLNSAAYIRNQAAQIQQISAKSESDHVMFGMLNNSFFLQIDLRLAIDPLPPRRNIVHYDFLKLQYISHNMRHVSPLRMEAVSCNNSITYVTL